MKIHFRKHCVLCEESILVSFAKFEQPIYECIAIDKTNDSWEIEYGYCENCYSIQLMKLADPSILYDENYFQPPNHTYLWIQHNISFIKFIIDHYNSDINNSIVEIGSSSFCLGKHLIEYYTDYTVFDYSIKQAIKRDNVKYIEGNCEAYEFPENSTIVMSHVFEHLYEPKKFIENCYNNKVKNLFIAIPSMNNVNQLYITNQHTFSYSDNDIEYIFGKFSYKLNDKIMWDSVDNSFPCLFFHFIRYEQELTIKREIILNKHNYTVNLLTNKITIPQNTFLSTCSMWSLIIYNLIENKENIIGFIDLSKQKQGKKFGITDIMVYPYEHLINYNKNANIFIFHPLKNNIINTVKNVNNKINIICM
jgi:hypothetical protein